MSFRLVPKSVTLNGVMAVTSRYFTEFGKCSVPTHNRVDLWRILCTSLLLHFVLRVRCRKSSRSLSHLLMSFLSVHGVNDMDRTTF